MLFVSTADAEMPTISHPRLVVVTCTHACVRAAGECSTEIHPIRREREKGRRERQRGRKREREGEGERERGRQGERERGREG